MVDNEQHIEIHLLVAPFFPTSWWGCMSMRFESSLGLPGIPAINSSIFGAVSFLSEKVRLAKDSCTNKGPPIVMEPQSHLGHVAAIAAPPELERRLLESDGTLVFDGLLADAKMLAGSVILAANIHRVVVLATLYRKPGRRLTKCCEHGVRVSQLHRACLHP